MRRRGIAHPQEPLQLDPVELRIFGERREDSLDRQLGRGLDPLDEGQRLVIGHADASQPGVDFDVDSGSPPLAARGRHQHVNSFRVDGLRDAQPDELLGLFLRERAEVQDRARDAVLS